MEFKYNDGGREAAGFKGYTDDCVTRAISIATGLPYKTVYNDLMYLSICYNNRKTKIKRSKSHPRTGIVKQVYKPYIEKAGGVWISCMGIGTGCQFNLCDRDFNKKGTYILRVSKHLTTVIDGVIHDTFDPSREGNRCVYDFLPIILPLLKNLNLYIHTLTNVDKFEKHKLRLLKLKIIKFIYKYDLFDSVQRQISDKNDLLIRFVVGDYEFHLRRDNVHFITCVENLPLCTTLYIRRENNQGIDMSFMDYIHILNELNNEDLLINAEINLKN